MRPITIPIRPEVEQQRLKTRSQKLRREIRRLLMQAKTLAMRPVSLVARNQFIFIMGHMRSGSSLLCHLLCSSDQILGFGETHTNYRYRSDLAKLLMCVGNQTGENPFNYRYVLDKIVGCQHVICRSVLTDRRCRYVFLVREPVATVASLIAMRRQFHDESQDQLLAFAARHYTKRIDQLLNMVDAIDDRERCLLVTHHQLLSETSSTFTAFERFFDLRAPLREEYDVMPTTGQPGVGDPSPNIRLGRIHRALPQKHIQMPAAMLSELQHCYENCLAMLEGSVQTVSFRKLAIYKRAA
jgi:hypothetical protein